MLSKFVMPGNKLDLQAVEQQLFSDDFEDEESAQELKTEEESTSTIVNGIDLKRVYQTSVYDVLSDERLEIYMPMEKTRMILLPVDVEFDVYFYTGNGLYQCYARVADRYKNEAADVVLLELTSNLRKHQRREFYRLDCSFEIQVRGLEKEEVQAMGKRARYLMPSLPFRNAVVVDISGGGMRFVSKHTYEQGSLICCKLNLLQNDDYKEYTITARVISSREVGSRQGLFEHRVQYVNMEALDREEIIRYIFEEERRIRKRKTGF
ncbi:MAG: flagellar brake protein [Lachnospiraceae bacterium]|jgi:Predicted glycosyltransferase|nr:flagellar brake protein [Lachnospiraceae bacterium]